jgi:hypothetical protein
MPSAFRKVLAGITGILLFSYFVSMGLGFYLLYASPQGLEAASERVAELPFSTLMVLNFRIPLGISLGLLFLAIWFLYVGTFGVAWLDKPTFPTSLKNSLSRLDLLHSNYLLVLPQLAAVVRVTVVLLHALQESAGVQTGGISFQNPVIGFVAVSYAPLVEEFSYRITTIGLLDGLNLHWKMRRLPRTERPTGAAHLLFLTMWKPEKAKELLRLNTIRSHGIRKGISRFEWILLATTSGAFGAVHYLSGGGWEIGKISTAMLSGLAMGFVYLRYGAYAPILLHWFFNYYFGTYDLASQLSIAGSDLAVAGVTLLNLGTGLVLAIVLIVTSLAKILTSKRHGT